MKKVKLLSTLLLSISLLVACGSVKDFEYNQTGICEETIEDKNRLRMEFYANENKIGAYKIMFGFNQKEFEGRTEVQIEEVIQEELGLVESPGDHIDVGFDHLDGYTFVSVHFKNLEKTSDEDFAKMGVKDRIEAGTNLDELIVKDNIKDEGIKCWIETE